MCVNDIITVGAKPLFFLDYFATSKLDVDQGEAVVKGIAEGCRQSDCALLGGETAELPGFYAPGEYDLAGFAVGVVSRKRIVDGKATRLGDKLVGVASSGLHSNGFSLARRVLTEGKAPLSLQGSFGSMGTLGDALLRPTRIYVKAAQIALEHGVQLILHCGAYARDESFYSWHHFVVSRAMENQVYLLSLNRAGADFGNSLFCGPWVDEAAPAVAFPQHEEAMLSLEVDPARIETVRRHYSFLADKLEDYGALGRPTAGSS